MNKIRQNRILYEGTVSIVRDEAPGYFSCVSKVVRTTKLKLKQTSLETVLKLFCFSFSFVVRTP